MTLKLILAFILFFLVISIGTGARSGSSSRSGSSRSRSSGGIQSTRNAIRTASSRLTRSSGFSNTNRFSGNRQTGFYRYGSFTGRRYGTSIRRNTYWPVYGIYYGYPYGPGYHRPISNSRRSIVDEVQISDDYTKKESTNGSLELYYCVNKSGQTVKTCYESVVDSGMSLNVSQDQRDFMVQDGGCCEGRKNNSAICCIIGLNKAIALQGIVFTLISLVSTSTVLALRVCR